MSNIDIAVELEKICRENLEALGLELVELVCRHEGSKLILRILADKSGSGITIGECAEINRRLGRILEEGDLIKESFVLEVSSPGLDRILSTAADFRRAINKKVKFFLSEPVNGKIEFDGVIKETALESVDIQADDVVVRIPLARINKAKRIIE